MMDGRETDRAEFSIQSARRVAESWAASHNIGVGRCRDFTDQWYVDTDAEFRKPEALVRELAFFFEAANRDAYYWQSIGNFTEDATGVWSLQAIQALASLSMVGLFATGVAAAAYEARLSTLAAWSAGLIFLVGTLLAPIALYLTKRARTRANIFSEAHEQGARRASTWEQLSSANVGDPNVGRKERKLALRIVLMMISAVVLGGVILVSSIWF